MRAPFGALVTLAAASAVALLACGPASPLPEEPAVVPPPVVEAAAPEPGPAPAPDRDGLGRVQEALKSRMWLLIDVGALRAHPARDELEASVVMRTPVVLHPELRHAAERILLTARNAQRSPHWAVVVEHGLSADEVDSFFDRLARSCEPHSLEGVERAVRCGRPGATLLVAAPTPRLVVYTRDEHPEVAAALVGSGGLRQPSAALETEVLRPTQTLAGRRMPPLPETITRGRGELRLEPEGAVLILQGQSATASQAKEDAETVNALIDALDLPGPDLLTGALRRALHFEPRGETVGLEKHLGLAQLRLFLLLVDMLSRSERPVLGVPLPARVPASD